MLEFKFSISVVFKNVTNYYQAVIFWLFLLIIYIWWKATGKTFMKRSDPNSFLHNQIYLYRELIYYTQQIGKFLAAAQSLASTCTNMLKKNLGFYENFAKSAEKD